MVKKILVPTDGSDYSRHALSTAVEYAKIFNAEIELLHVVSVPPYGMYDFTFSFFSLSDGELDDVGKKLLEVTGQGIDLSDVKITRLVVSGYPATEIVNAISNNVDLVIMGSHGRRPLAGAILGSVTQRVLADTSCPVLVVK